jgi:hypothetical protein
MLARLGWSDRPGGKAWVAWRHGLVAVHGHVHSGAGEVLGMREHGTRAARTGRLGGVGLPRSGQHARWSLVESGPRNRSFGSGRCCRQGDGLGGGRCSSAQVGCPQWPWQRLQGQEG